MSRYIWTSECSGCDAYYVDGRDFCSTCQTGLWITSRREVK